MCQFLRIFLWWVEEKQFHSGEDLRVRAMTDPHSPPEYRINGVLLNMAEFEKAFACQPGQPMTKPAKRSAKSGKPFSS